MLMPNVWIWLGIKGICYNLGKAMRGYIVRSGGCLYLLDIENLGLFVIVGTTLMPLHKICHCAVLLNEAIQLRQHVGWDIWDVVGYWVI